MFRPTSRLIASSTAARAIPRFAAPPTRRFISTAPPTQKSRSWKSLFARFGAAGAIIYYYNTTDVFAEEPRNPLSSSPETDADNESLLTIDALAQERQQRREAEAAAAEKAAKSKANVSSRETGVAGGVEGLEEEADQQGAFNPETGEINWDCPCLGGMAHGPCGEEFKAAFSCFVYSTEEPKGMDCIDRFKNMQNCFREYPEVYGSELDTDEDLDESADRDQAAVTTTEQSTQNDDNTQNRSEGLASANEPKPASKSGSEARGIAAAPSAGKKNVGPLPDSGEDLTKAIYDQTDANNEASVKEEK